MNSQNLYHLLDIPDYSDITIVKKAFRQLALKYHPDRNPDESAVGIFKNLVNAYEILSHPESKEPYDNRLRNGFVVNYTDIPIADSEREIQKRRYAKMRNDRDELQQVENITAYENSLKVMPFMWRLILLGFISISGILAILNDWYQKENGIAVGLFLFILSNVILWNELYKHFWHISLTKEEKRYERQAYSHFLTLFFLGIFLIFCLVKIKKVWQLQNFGKVIVAYVNPEQTLLSYSYNNNQYTIDISSIPEEFENRNFIIIRISTKEPEIWEYVED